MTTSTDEAILDELEGYELVKGKLVAMSPTSYLHGFIETNIAAILRQFVRQYQLGRVLGGEVGIYTHRQPDTVRAADVVFISHKRLAQVHSVSYLDVAPELVVEVLSAHDRWPLVLEKLDEYFQIGVEIVWLIECQKQQVYVYHSMTQNQCLTAEQLLTAGEILPGFQVTVAELFE